jgi:hypothetical protein
VAPTSKEQLKYFSNANNSTTLTPPGSSGAFREAKLSTKFEFGSLFAKIGSETKKLQKSVKKPSFFEVFLVISEIF